VRRRAAEAALFMDDAEPTEMAQKVDAPDRKMKVGEIVGKVAVPVAGVAGGGTHMATKQAEPVPTPAPAPKAKASPKQVIEKAQETKAIVEQAKDLGIAAHGFGKWAMGDGMLISIGLTAVVAVVVLIPKIRERLA
jgi:hypothetical protein